MSRRQPANGFCMKKNLQVGGGTSITTQENCNSARLKEAMDELYKVRQLREKALADLRDAKIRYDTVEKTQNTSKITRQTKSHNLPKIEYKNSSS